MVPGTDPWSGRAADGPHDADGGESESGDGPGRYQLEADGTIAAVSDGLLALTGYERSGLLGEHVSTLLSGEDPDRYEVAMGRLHSDGQLPATDVAVTLRTADGDPLPCSIRVVALAGDDDWASVGLVSPCDGSAAVEPPPGVGAVTEVLNATADVGVLLVDETGTIRWANETAAEYFGRDPASLVGMDRRDVETTVPTPDSGEETGDHVADDIGRSAHLDESGRDGSAAPDVETRLVERRCTGITDGPLSGGRLEVYHDVTERKRDPRRVQLYASIVENAGHVGFTMDADGTLTYMSPQVEELIDVDHRELVGKSVAELAELTVATAAERDQVRRHVEQLLQRGDEPKQFEVTMETDRRGEHVVEMVLQPLGQDGDVEMVVGTARDVTERVEQRIELQRERYLNELLFETAPVGIMVVEPDGTIIRANERVKTIVGIDDRDVTGLDYTTLEYTLWTPDGEALLQPLIRDGEVVRDFDLEAAVERCGADAEMVGFGEE
jgi:PAS domain S-box-containing protein